MIFLILSVLATGASWLCYFKALQLADVNRVTPIDKFSTILTMGLVFIPLEESLTLFKYLGMIGIMGIESNLVIAIRAIVILLMVWLVVFITKKQKEVKGKENERL